MSSDFRKEPVKDLEEKVKFYTERGFTAEEAQIFAELRLTTLTFDEFVDHPFTKNNINKRAKILDDDEALRRQQRIISGLASKDVEDRQRAKEEWYLEF